MDTHIHAYTHVHTCVLLRARAHTHSLYSSYLVQMEGDLI